MMFRATRFFFCPTVGNQTVSIPITSLMPNSRGGAAFRGGRTAANFSQTLHLRFRAS